MAQTPQPRSYQAILGDLIDTFESKFGIPTLRVGSPLLRTFEAAAQSDFRSSNDIFALLRAQDLDQASGPALLLIAADENLQPIAESQASGPVQITDTSFAKKSTKIFQGQAAPIVGSTVVYVQDASTFPTSGSIYIGRGTTNYEGPLGYTAKTNLGTFWSLTLSTATQRYHNFGESVILAQGGDRIVSAGSTVQTPQGNAQNAVQFSTIYAITLPDGETTVQNVQVVAKSSGIVGNVTAGGINAFSNPPFSGAAVTNLVPFTNATAQETQEALRERIRNTRQSRSLGTPLAIKTGITGLTASDENTRVVSASVVARAGFPTTLYIDDGTGYEEKDTGVAFETLVASAIGGEQYFTVASAPPVAKAFVTSSITAPFNLTEGCVLAVELSGLIYIHAFAGTDFRAIGNATAQEVVASINGDPIFPLSARTANSGTKVVVFAKQDSDETLQVVTPTVGQDANEFFNFPTTPVQTMALFKNDRLLSKDGRAAALTSNPQVAWASFSGAQTLTIDVDGTGSVTYTFTDADFVNAATGYVTLNSANSLAAWVAVLNARIPGVTASIANGGLTLSSNRSHSSRASLEIAGSSLVTGGVFTIPSSQLTLFSRGADNDYSLDRNRGEIFLVTPLSAGDTLSIGTIDTRAFIQSSVISSITLTQQADLWFAVDGAATIVPTGVLANSQVTLAAFALTPPDASHARVRVNLTVPAAGIFSNVAPNDWVIFEDSGFNVANRGAWRVSLVANDGSYFEICRPALGIPETVQLSSLGLVFVRTNAYLQKAIVPAASNYTATSLALILAGQIDGTAVETYKTNFLRIRSNTEATTGDIALVCASPSGLLIGLPVSNAVSGVTPDAGVAESTNPEYGTPQFTAPTVNTNVSPTSFTVASASGVAVDAGKQLVFLRDLPDTNSGTPYSRAGSNLGFNSAIDSIVSNTTINLRHPALVEFINKGRFFSASPLAMGPMDNLTVLVDGDTASKRYAMNTFRRVVPTSTTYGVTNSFLDVDNGNQTLAAAFGTSSNFVDYALYMKARTKSHAVGGDTTKTILWRWWRHGPAGNGQVMQYVYPINPSAGITATTDAASALVSVAQVRLSSGAPRTNINVRATTHVGAIVESSSPNQQITYFLGLSIGTASRTSGTTTISTSFTGTAATDHGLQTGNIVFVKSTNVNFASGAYTITRTGAATFTYSESGADQGSTSSIGTVSYDSSGEATFTGSSVVSGDIAYVSPATTLAVALKVPGKINVLGTQFWKAKIAGAPATVSTAITWGLLGDPQNLRAYPLNASNNVASSIATAVNALAAVANSTSPVTAVAVGNGVSANGTIDAATFEDTDASSIQSGFVFSDGVQNIRNETQPANLSDNYVLTFKAGVTASLATNSDWQNEDCRLAPLTAVNLVGWFNTPGVSGLFSASDVVASSRAGKLQLTTLTAGSSGSVQVQGGTANSATASVVSSASNVAGAAQLVTVRIADTTGFVDGQWCELANAAPVTKPLFNSSSSVSAIATTSGAVATPTPSNQGVLTMAVGNLWTQPAATVTNASFQFEKQGGFTSIVYAGVDGALPFSGVSEGDWVVVATTGTTAPAVSPRNLGTFRVVRASTTQLWIENPTSSEEVSNATLLFAGSNSMMPGDTFQLNATGFGTNNAGTYTVVASYAATINGVAYSTSQQQVVVSPAFQSTYAGPTVLGTNNTLWQVTEGTPSKLVKQLSGISPNPGDGSLADMKFLGTYGSERVNPVAGTVVTALDKLGFPTTLSAGTDAYSHAVGLIGAVNQTAYGDASDPTQFPGIIAAGANINIEGPLVRRIQVSLGVRVRSGVATSDIKDRVKAGVAQTINNTGIGQSIALGALVAAAQKVNGVVAVVITSPTYGTGNDLIAVQPFEKALVLNLDQDVTVTLIGT